MLSRRHLRIKVLQALYQHNHDSTESLATGLKKLNASIDNIYRLYLYELKCLADILKIAGEEIERRKNKKLPSEEDLNPSLNFVNNAFLNWLSVNNNFIKMVEDQKVSWRDEQEILRKIFRSFSESEEYQSYLELENPSLEEQKRIIKFLYGAYVVPHEVFHQFYEDYNIHWSDDLDAAQMMVVKTLKSFNEKSDENSSLPELIKEKDDLDFARTLYTRVYNNSEAFEKLIQEKAKHWELDRIALMDMLLMKQGLAELMAFSEIPVKVTLNEYIELSKEYSTPKSGNFINGILDKLRIELSEKGEIRKIGRGLL